MAAPMLQPFLKAQFQIPHQQEYEMHADNEHENVVIDTNKEVKEKRDDNQEVNLIKANVFSLSPYVGSHYYSETFGLNKGKCGPCGDDWEDPAPRSNENGGLYGNGQIVAENSLGSIIETTALISANHLGSVYFHLCDLSQNPDALETEQCFKPLFLADGTTHYSVHPLDLKVEVKLRLPDDVVCEHCVLRWHYRTGNFWGLCADGTQNMGCGNQDIFRSCADIRITAPTNILPENSVEDISDVSKEHQPILPPPSHCKEPCVIPQYFKNPHTRRDFHYKHKF